jgi:hypothetical protein
MATQPVETSTVESGQPAGGEAAISTAATLYPNDSVREEPVNDTEPVDEQPEGEAQEEVQVEEQPSLEAPNSWNSEDRAEWEALPRKQQETILRREGERDRAFQQKAQEAATVKQSVEREAAGALQQVMSVHAQQLEAFMPQLPQAPDPRLLSTGQQEHRDLYWQQKDAFEAASAQRQQVQQMAEQARQQASQLEQAQLLAEKQAGEQVLSEKLGTEWTDPSKRQKLLTDLEPIGGELGYSAELMRQANATDILALKLAHSWKSKADKWDAAQKAKMEPVRAAKAQQLPKVTQPGVAGVPGQQGNQPKDIRAILYPNDVRR